jgi:hypothetical protein
MKLWIAKAVERVSGMVVLFPSWILYRWVKDNLPEDHPWKKCSFTLWEWSDGGTPLLYHVSFMMWIGFMTCMSVLVQLL